MAHGCPAASIDGGGLTGVSKFDQEAQIPVSRNVELAATRNLEAHHKPRLLPNGRSFGGDIPAWRRADRYRTNGGQETSALVWLPGFHHAMGVKFALKSSCQRYFHAFI